MRTLRSTYYQEKKKIQNSIRSGSGSDTVYTPNILWFKEMDGLLKDVDDRRATIDNVNNSANSEIEDSSIVASDTQETISDNLNLTHEDITSTPEQIYAETLQPAVKTVSKRKGIFRAIGELKKLQEAINTEIPVPTDKENRFDVFGKSVAMQLRALSFERVMTGQAKIQNILSDLSIENYRYTNMSVYPETFTSSERSTPIYTNMSVSPETITSSERLTPFSEYSADNILSQVIVMTLENNATVLPDETQ